MAALLGATLGLLPIFNHAPNRLLSGESLTITQLPGETLWWLMLPIALLILLSLVPGQRWSLLLTLALGEMLFIGLLLLTGQIAHLFAVQSSALARTSQVAAYG